MKIVCDNCSTKYSIADEKVRGKVFKIKCKKCSHIIVVKGQEIATDVQAAGFDQKETKVFDYSGFEGQKDAQGADPIWHLVIDREQVGPLTMAELQQKWTSGEADVDTYAWREGFDDWKRLGAIEELASILRRPEAPAAAEPARGPGAGLFGAGAVPTTDAALPTVSRADPTDLFAGAGSSTEDEPPNDLFGGGRPAPAPSVFASSAAPAAEKPSVRRAPKEDQPLFSMAAAEGGGGNGYGTDPIPKADVRPMTAQRNENSVLFSLNNLAALATNAADPAPPKSNVGSSFGSSGPEGSGLIDIRAMAAMTLGGGKRDEGPRHRSSDTDDLPVFSASSFSTPAAAVLLPTVQKSSSRGLYILGGVLGFLVLAMIGLVAFLFLGGRRAPIETAPPPTATTAPPSTSTPPPAATTTPPPAATTTPTGQAPTPPAATTKPPTPAPSQPTPPAQPPPSQPVAATQPTPPQQQTREQPHTTPPPPKHTTERPAPPVEKPPAEPPPAKAAATEPPPAAPTKAAKCDEVACLVTPDLPCCPKKAGSAAPTRAPSTDSSVPDKLDQSDIIAGMKNVNARVLGCNDKAKGAGAFKVKVTVGPDGSVSAAQASPPVAGTAAASCVEGAVRSAKFKKTKNSITFNYPYTFH